MRESRKLVRRGVFLGLCLVAATVPAAIVYWRHTVPLSQCSEVYRRFRDLPGVQASFIHDKQINDTLFLDMTLFVADDSLAFVNMLRAMGKGEEYIKDLMSLKVSTNTSFSQDCLRGAPEKPRDENPANNEVISYFPTGLAVAVFHTHTEEEVEVTVHKCYFAEIDIH